MVSLILIAVLSQQARAPAGAREAVPVASSIETAPSQLSASGAFAMWRFDETSAGNNLTDATALNTTMTRQEGAAPSSGVVGGARGGIWGSRGCYYGNNDCPTWTGDLGAGGLTIEMWLKRTGSSAGTLFSAFGGDMMAIELILNSSGSITVRGPHGKADVPTSAQCYTAGGAIGSYQTTALFIASSGWEHLAVTRASGSAAVKFYRNGAYVETSSAVIDPCTAYQFPVRNDINIGIGQHGNYESILDLLTGTELDEMRVVKSERNAAQILADYQAGTTQTTVTVGRTAVSPARADVSSSGTRCSVSTGCL
jgi:hypothetical protein